MSYCWASTELIGIGRRLRKSPAIHRPNPAHDLWGKRLHGLESRDFTRLAQHFVDFTEMLFLFGDHFARVFFDKHRTVAHQIEQLLVECQS